MSVAKEAYPTEIMPRKSYRKLLCVDKLLRKYRGLMVVRQINGMPEDYMIVTEGGEEEISTKVFGSSMANLSLNLAGGVFDTDKDAHLRFLPLSEIATASWEGKKVNPDIVKPQDSYSFTSPCFGLCFLVERIHERTFPFYKVFNTAEERDAYAQKAIEATTETEKAYDAHLVGAFQKKGEKVEVKPRIKVHHSPTNANYWHATLDTYRPTDKSPVMPDEDLGNSDKKMFKALKQDLVRCCDINRAPDYRISRFSYTKCRYWLCAI